jgi:hypothetical protein
MIMQIETNSATFTARTHKDRAGFAAVVERRTGDTAKLIYRQVFPTRYHAAKTARAAVKSHAANHAFTN